MKKRPTTLVQLMAATFLAAAIVPATSVAQSGKTKGQKLAAKAQNPVRPGYSATFKSHLITRGGERPESKAGSFTVRVPFDDGKSGGITNPDSKQRCMIMHLKGELGYEIRFEGSTYISYDGMGNRKIHGGQFQGNEIQWLKEALTDRGPSIATGTKFMLTEFLGVDSFPIEVQVVAKSVEPVSTPAGDFQAYRCVGEATDWMQQGNIALFPKVTAWYSNVAGVLKARVTSPVRMDMFGNAMIIGELEMNIEAESIYANGKQYGGGYR